MSWFQRILGNAPAQQDIPSPSTGFFDMDGRPVPLSLAAQDIRAARELVRTAAMRTASSFGIPANWLSYEVVTISDEEKAYFQLQVSLRIWDEQLWAQSGAFEQQALKRIREDDVNVARAVRAVLWRVLPDAGCPHDELSPAAAWKAEAVSSRAQAYERLRADLAAPALATLPSVVTGLDASETLPTPRSLESQFKDTYPGAPTGFDATRPFLPDDNAASKS